MKPDVIGIEYVPCSYILVDFVVTLLGFKPCLQDLADWNDKLVIVEDFMDNTSHNYHNNVLIFLRDDRCLSWRAFFINHRICFNLQYIFWSFLWLANM